MNKKPKIVALVPMRHQSERVPQKNYRPFAGQPLFHRIITNLAACSLIDQIVINTDSPTVKQDAAKNFPPIKIIDRPNELLGGGVPMNDILLYDVTQVAADFYIQVHSTSPLLSAATITKAIESFLSAYPKYDTLFSVTKIRTRFWDKEGKAVNHDPNVLLRTQDLPPMFEENSGIYIFSRKSLEEQGNRVGKKPFMFEMDRLEALDIDEELDFKVCEFLFKEKQKVG